MKQKKIKLFRFLCEPSEHAAYKTDTDLNESKVIYSSPRRKRQRKSIEQDFKAHFVEIKMVEYVETMDIEDEKEEEDKADSTEKKYGLFIWPCSIVLSHFILQNPTLFKEKNILEIGCGTALPGITCAVHTVAKKVSTYFKSWHIICLT
jgi:predicted nicotinamide N-methyase